MVRLSVNLNKVALLRNSRRTGVPDVTAFAGLCIKAGAKGITLHPRPDERHVRRSDVDAIAEAMAPVRPGIELNLEGRPTADFLDLVARVRPEQCTLVPDAPGAFTSEQGWRIGEERADLEAAIAALRPTGTRIILFMDPDDREMADAAALGIDGVEIYTGTYAAAFRAGDHGRELADCLRAAEAAHRAGLIVNAGHDLNTLNLPPLRGMAGLREVSIGHELTADALIHGFPATVRMYIEALGG
jgi:pyridoxine 5-phosphate synthase